MIVSEGGDGSAIGSNGGIFHGNHNYMSITVVNGDGETDGDCADGGDGLAFFISPHFLSDLSYSASIVLIPAFNSTNQKLTPRDELVRQEAAISEALKRDTEQVPEEARLAQER